MKCLAARLPTLFRGGDLEDIKFLVRKLRLRSMAEVDAIVGDYYGDRRLENGKRWLVEKLIAEVNAKK
jgi:tRNA G10  N-methylase Trm11